VHRSDPAIATPNYVGRSTFAPRVTIPLHWKSWLGVTSTYSFLATRYGVQQNGSTIVDAPAWRKLGEFRLDLRPPSLERVWERPQSKWKHTIEPRITYTYAIGKNDFTRFIRIDEDDTITNTNEIEYSITQRLFRRTASGASQELASWSLLQKYYFDPTFGGALVAGQSNILQALDSVTPFGFADGPRRFSPLVSDFKIMPGGMYDLEFRTDYDFSRRRFTTAESLLKIHPYKDFAFTVAHYAIDASSVLQPVSNQVRLLASYGGLNRPGWSASLGLSYDLRQERVQNELFEVNYNGSCCGLAFGYQRLSLGQIRTENQFRVSFIIANVGEFGNLRRQEKVF
jgi:LPS-assembly protein